MAVMHYVYCDMLRTMVYGKMLRRLVLRNTPQKQFCFCNMLRNTEAV